MAKIAFGIILLFHLVSKSHPYDNLSLMVSIHNPVSPEGQRTTRSVEAVPIN
jgi:hypothetical protein